MKRSDDHVEGLPPRLARYQAMKESGELERAEYSINGLPVPKGEYILAIGVHVAIFVVALPAAIATSIWLQTLWPMACWLLFLMVGMLIGMLCSSWGGSAGDMWE